MYLVAELVKGFDQTENESLDASAYAFQRVFVVSACRWSGQLRLKRFLQTYTVSTSRPFGFRLGEPYHMETRRDPSLWNASARRRWDAQSENTPRPQLL